MLNPALGIPLGNNTYTIWLKIAIKGKGKGKSGGARVIAYLETELIANLLTSDSSITVNLISIYDK